MYLWYLIKTIHDKPNEITGQYLRINLSISYVIVSYTISRSSYFFDLKKYISYLQFTSRIFVVFGVMLHLPFNKDVYWLLTKRWKETLFIFKVF